MSKHTPEDWELSGMLEEAPAVVAMRTGEDGPAEIIIADLDVDGAVGKEERWANARLIAAAPEMLELLGEAMPYLPVRGVDLQAKARALLAKIEGTD